MKQPVVSAQRYSPPAPSQRLEQSLDQTATSTYGKSRQRGRAALIPTVVRWSQVETSVDFASCVTGQFSAGPLVQIRLAVDEKCLSKEVLQFVSLPSVLCYFSNVFIG